jgi:hypothetical protein
LEDYEVIQAKSPTHLASLAPSGLTENCLEGKALLLGIPHFSEAPVQQDAPPMRGVCNLVYLKGDRRVLAHASHLDALGRMSVENASLIRVVDWSYVNLTIEHEADSSKSIAFQEAVDLFVR